MEPTPLQGTSDTLRCNATEQEDYHGKKEQGAIPGLAPTAWLHPMGRFGAGPDSCFLLASGCKPCPQEALHIPQERHQEKMVLTHRMS
jgi:hypothetical protein